MEVVLTQILVKIRTLPQKQKMRDGTLAKVCMFACCYSNEGRGMGVLVKICMPPWKQRRRAGLTKICVPSWRRMRGGGVCVDEDLHTTMEIKDGGSVEIDLHPRR
jgi:hypothetical protein